MRKVAVERIADQRVLADIAKNDKSWLVRKVAAERITDHTTKDQLLVDIEFKRLEEGLRGSGESAEKLAREAAEELIAWARRKPILLREKWDEIAYKIQHKDEVVQRYSVYRDGGETHEDEWDHADSGQHGFRDLTFPPKPTDF